MPDPQQGDLFGDRYRIEAVIGEGGFAKVYRATDTATGVPVAVKVLRPEGQDYSAEMRARFQREVALLARMNHPTIIRQLDFGESPEGLLFVVFELLEGRDLSEFLRDGGRLSAAQTTSVLRQLLEALDVAHTAGLLHRDIKPQNVRVVAQDGTNLTVKLMDWGIARTTDDAAPAVTATGAMVGTPRYMSPEQLLSRPLDARSDIYSLGLMVFELLMGRAALANNTIYDQIDRMCSGYVLSVPELERIGSNLLAVIQQMTEREPERRFSSARDVLIALEGEPVRARRRWLIPAVAGLVVAAVAAFALTRPDEPQTARARPPSIVVTQPKPAVPAGHEDRDEVEVPEVAEIPEKEGHGRPPSEEASGGCSKPAPFDGFGELDGTLMTWLPYGYSPDRMYPVVLLLHDDNEDPKVLLASSKFRELADEHGFILAAPSGPEVEREFTSRVVSWGPGGAEKVLKDLDRAERELCVDRGRIFVASHGRGGQVAVELSCDDRIKAIAANGQAFRYSSTNSSWDFDHRFCDLPKPTLWVLPTESAVLPLDEGSACDGRRYVGQQAVEERVRLRNGCTNAEPDVDDLSTGTCKTWTCEVPFTSCGTAGGFGWPGLGMTAKGKFTDCGTETPSDFPLEAKMWEFFSAISKD